MKKVKVLSTLCAFVLAAVIALSLPARAADVVSVKMDNVSVSQKSMELYFTTNSSGQLSKQNVSVMLDDSKLKVNSVDLFSKSSEGISYIFLVDVSGSMKPQMDATKALLKGLIASMTAQDKVAVVTVANSVKPGAFSSDKNTLSGQVDAITVTNEDTNLYRGITSSIDMFSSYQSQLTARKALIVVSDGDEDFNSGITKDEALSKIADAHIPVFTYATLSASPSSEQIESSKVFGSFARTSSGGIDFTNAQDQKDILAKLTGTLQNSYTVKTELDANKFEGKKLYLELDVKSGDVTVKDGYDLRVSVTKSQSSVSGSSSAPKSTKSSGSSGTKNSFLQAILKPQVLIPSVAGVVLIIVLIIVLVVVRSKKKAKQTLEEPPLEADNSPIDMSEETLNTEEIPEQNVIISDQEPYGGTVAIPVIEAVNNEPNFSDSIGKTMPMATPQPQKAPAKQSIAIRLANISANSKHDVFELTIEDSLVLGRDPQRAKLAFQSDYMMSGKHCQLSYIDHKVYLNDLGSTNGTFVNGIPISGSYKLESDDVISVGSTELRIVF